MENHILLKGKKIWCETEKELAILTARLSHLGIQFQRGYPATTPTGLSFYNVCRNDGSCYLDFDEGSKEWFEKDPAKEITISEIRPIIYTHDEAFQIVEMFEDVLDRYGVKLPSDEDAERGEDNEAALYGSTYSDLLDAVEDHLIRLVERTGAKTVIGEFSGKI